MLGAGYVIQNRLLPVLTTESLTVSAEQRLPEREVKLGKSDCQWTRHC